MSISAINHLVFLYRINPPIIMIVNNDWLSYEEVVILGRKNDEASKWLDAYWNSKKPNKCQMY